MPFRSSFTVMALALAVTFSMPTAGMSQALSFRAGTRTAAVRSEGFTQQLQILNGQPPSQAATGVHPDGLIGMVVCAQNKDIVVVVSGTNPDPYTASLAQALNRH
jgi:hypothetical protein